MLATAQNVLLEALAQALTPRTAASLERVPLQRNQILVRAGDAVRYAYFPTAGLVSIAALTAAGQAVDLAVIAQEGLVGVSALFGNEKASHHAIVRLEGSAFRISGGILQREFALNERLRAVLLEYAYRLSLDVAQSATCLCYHTVLQRLCRWLLIASDKTSSDVIDMTQDSLAQVLGVARSAVTRAALELQDAGAIRSRHGRIQLVNRTMLRRSACECTSPTAENPHL
jgi:CRP-like cAMP-binding protein